MSTRKRKAAYDVMRIVAILQVLYCHTPGYHLFHNAHGAALFGGMACSVLCRIGVPLFAMVSGALLLGRNESYRDLWQKRISRMLLVVLIFEGLLYLEFHFTRGTTLSLTDFVYGMLGGTLKNFTSYWFLYAYLGFLIMLPFLRSVAQRMERADFIWLMGVHIALTTGPILLTFACECLGVEQLKISPTMAVSLSSVMLYFYPLIGFWIDRNVDVHALRRRHWLLLVGLTVVGMLVSGLMTWHHNVVFHDRSQQFISASVYMTAITMFLAIKRLFDSEFDAVHTRLSRVFCLVGPLVFGVYLLDQGLKLLVYERFKDTLMPTLGTYGFSLFWVAVSLVVCSAITWELKQLPVFRKIL